MATEFTFHISSLRLSKILMISTIVLIGAFQCYWINKLYHEERDTLKKEADVVFRDVMYKLQVERFRKDSSFFKKTWVKNGEDIPDNLFVIDVIDSMRTKAMDSALRVGLKGRVADYSISLGHEDTVATMGNAVRRINTMHIEGTAGEDGPHIMKYFSTNKNFTDSFPLKRIDSAYKKELLKNGIDVPYTVEVTSGSEAGVQKALKSGDLKTNFTFVGLSKAYAYQASLGNPFGYIVNKIKLPILVGIMLIAFTIISFVFLYHNLVQQQKLAAIKNEFISNITHELKTPIATVNVAIEALRNFNALQNPERTKEYLDISALELQRLSMLVDKVLKLSMFENKEIELKKERIDLHQLAAEVITSMKLQFDKAGAIIQLTKEGNEFWVLVDKLHITSVLYNLLDNALKYAKNDPYITVHLSEDPKFVTMSVSDNGIGIPAAYKDKIFEKFFRVPSGDHHNIKGYGLGLSYVHHIILKHYGSISVDSAEGKGSTFIIKLPKA